MKALTMTLLAVFSMSQQALAAPTQNAGDILNCRATSASTSASTPGPATAVSTEMIFDPASLSPSYNADVGRYNVEVSISQQDGYILTASIRKDYMLNGQDAPPPTGMSVALQELVSTDHLISEISPSKESTLLSFNNMRDENGNRRLIQIICAKK